MNGSINEGGREGGRLDHTAVRCLHRYTQMKEQSRVGDTCPFHAKNTNNGAEIKKI